MRQNRLSHEAAKLTKKNLNIFNMPFFVPLRLRENPLLILNSWFIGLRHCLVKPILSLRLPGHRPLQVRGLTFTACRLHPSALSPKAAKGRGLGEGVEKTALLLLRAKTPVRAFCCSAVAVVGGHFPVISRSGSKPRSGVGHFIRN